MNIAGEHFNFLDAVRFSFATRIEMFGYMWKTYFTPTVYIRTSI